MNQIIFMLKNNLKAIFIALVIFYLSTTENDNLEPPWFLNFQHVDKLIHFAMYFTFMFILIYDNRIYFERKRNYLIIGLIPFVFGVIMEVCQGVFTKTRSADFFDVLFNSLGIIIAISFWKYLIYTFKRRSD